MAHVTVKTRGSSQYKCGHLGRRMFFLDLEDAPIRAETAEKRQQWCNFAGRSSLFFIVARTAAIGLYRLIDDI